MNIDNISRSVKLAACRTIEAVKYVVEDSKTIKNICKIATKSFELAKNLALDTGLSAELAYKTFSTTNTVLESFGTVSVAHYFVNGEWKRDHWTKRSSMVAAAAISVFNTAKLGAKLALLNLAELALKLGRVPFVGRLVLLPLEGVLCSLSLIVSTFSLADNAIKVNRLRSGRSHSDDRISAKSDVWRNSPSAQAPIKLQKWKNRAARNLSEKKAISGIVCDVAKIAVAVSSLAVLLFLGGIPAVGILVLALGIASNVLPIAKLISDKFLEKEFNRQFTRA